MSATINQRNNVASDRATLVSFNWKIATKLLAIVKRNIARVSSRALSGERRLKYAALNRTKSTHDAPCRVR